MKSTWMEFLYYFLICIVLTTIAWATVHVATFDVAYSCFNFLYQYRSNNNDFLGKTLM